MLKSKIDILGKQGSSLETVECMVYLPEKGKKNGEVCCGLSNGSIVGYDTETGKQTWSVKPHLQIVTCIGVFGDYIWSGSFDKSIQLTNLKSKKPAASLTLHLDAVTCFVQVSDSCVLSMGLNGQIIEWDFASIKKTTKEEYFLRDQHANTPMAIYSAVRIEDNIWVGAGTAIVVLSSTMLRPIVIIDSYTSHEVITDYSWRTMSPSGDGPDRFRPFCIPRPKELPPSSRGASNTMQRSSTSVPSSPARPSKKNSTPVFFSSTSTNSSTNNVFLAPGSNSSNPSTTSLTLPKNSSNNQIQVPSSGGSILSASPRFSSFSPNTQPTLNPRLSSNSSGSIYGMSPSNPMSNPSNGFKSLGRSFEEEFDNEEDFILWGGGGDAGVFSPPKYVSMKPTNIYQPSKVPFPSSFDSTQLSIQVLGSHLEMNPSESTIPETPSSTNSSTNTSTSSSNTKDSSSKGSPSKEKKEEKEGFLFSPSKSSKKGQPVNAPMAGANPRTSFLYNSNVSFKASHANISAGSKRHPPGDIMLLGLDGEVWTCSKKTGSICIWDSHTYTLVRECRLNELGIFSVLRVGETIWMGSKSGSLYVWDAISHLPLQELRYHRDMILCLCLGDEEAVFSAAGVRDGTVAQWLSITRGRHATQAHMNTYVALADRAETCEFVAFDRYGFIQAYSLDKSLQRSDLFTPLPDSDQKKLELFTAAHRQHCKRWDEYMNNSAPNVHNFVRSEELRTLVRGGIPDYYRQHMWSVMVHEWVRPLREQYGSGYYASLSSHVAEGSYPRQIDMDLLRTFPMNRMFQEGASAINKMRRVLAAFCRHNPRVEYCQGFNFIVGFCLLFLKEELAFWLFVALIELILPSGYYVHPMLDIRVDQLVLVDYMQKATPGICKYLHDMEIDLNFITFNWLFTIFVDCVPTDVNLRIWDNLLLEGDLVMFRYSAALLKCHGALLSQISDKAELMTFLRVVSKLPVDLIKLTAYAFQDLGMDVEEFLKERRRVHKAELEATRVVESEKPREQIMSPLYSRLEMEGRNRTGSTSSDLLGSQPGTPLVGSLPDSHLAH